MKKLSQEELDKMVLGAIEGVEGKAEGKQSPLKKLLEIARIKKAGEGETK